MKMNYERKATCTYTFTEKEKEALCVVSNIIGGIYDSASEAEFEEIKAYPSEKSYDFIDFDEIADMLYSFCNAEKIVMEEGIEHEDICTC